jgi:hypothetical protein
VKTLFQRSEHYYSLYEGLKVAGGILDVMKRNHAVGAPTLFLETGNADHELAKAKTALKTAINITRPLGLTPSNGKSKTKRIISHHVDLKALAKNLRTAEMVVNAAELLCKDGPLFLYDTAIEFPGNGTEIAFTTDEYIALAKRALTEAVQRAESETICPEFSIQAPAVLDSLPAWEKKLIDGAFPLGGLQDPAVREKVTKAQLVFGFDVSKGYKGTIFFGRQYFKELVDRKARVPADEAVSFTFHSELEGHLKLAAAVQVLKGSCDLL